MDDPTTFSGSLADFNGTRVTIVCPACGRRGKYRVTALRAAHGNPPMAEVPRFVALKGGCELALKWPGTDCSASFEGTARAVEMLLGQALAGKWELRLRCERHHQGLKSTQPCKHPFALDVPSLVAAYGHDCRVDELNRKLCCPGCGSKAFSLMWVVPKQAA